MEPVALIPWQNTIVRNKLRSDLSPRRCRLTTFRQISIIRLFKEAAIVARLTSFAKVLHREHSMAWRPRRRVWIRIGLTAMGTNCLIALRALRSQRRAARAALTRRLASFGFVKVPA